jgi:hypothetical protein
VKNFCHVVGLSYDGFEDQMLVLFSTIEASRNQNFAGNASELRFKPRGGQIIRLLLTEPNRTTIDHRLPTNFGLVVGIKFCFKSRFGSVKILSDLPNCLLTDRLTKPT